ncbi:MAG TPA: MbcA/ParS/Xre antitoxin family protein [Bryobacteraceae bacterium]|nr:MbcA/ParS/Xre antitoxin family protein [Bryobacteraceae bacterium]
MERGSRLKARVGASTRPLKSTRVSGARISSKSVQAHALETFGTTEKAEHWMNRANPLFDGKTPKQVMKTDPAGVEAELVRIDHGVYM